MFTNIVNVNFFKFGLFTRLFRLKWILAFIILCIYPLFSIAEINKIEQFSLLKSNILDVFFYQFGLHTNILLVFIPLYLVLISDLVKDLRLDTYVFIRFDSVLSWWLTKVLLLFLITLIYILLAFILCFFVASFAYPIELDWSNNPNNLILNGNVAYFNVDFSVYNPLITLSILFILLFLVLFFLGLLLSLTSLFFKKSIIPFSLGIFINFLLLIFIKINNSLGFFKFLFPHNKIFLQFQVVSLNIFNMNSFVFSFFYWIILIFIIFIISIFIIKKVDLYFEVNDE